VFTEESASDDDDEDVTSAGDGDVTEPRDTSRDHDVIPSSCDVGVIAGDTHSESITHAPAAAAVSSSCVTSSSLSQSLASSDVTVSGRFRLFV